METLLQVTAELAKQIDVVCEKLLKRMGDRAVEIARDQKLFHASDSFNDAINFHPLSETVGFVLADKDYSGYLEDGNFHGPNGWTIKPKNAKALHFFIGNQEFFRKSVRAHPAYRFMEKSGVQLEKELSDIFDEVCSEIIEAAK